MSGDPKQCRKNAFRCAQLAHEARSPEFKAMLIDLSQNWMRLALELDRNIALMDDYPEPKKPGQKKKPY
jgi:hypothetical protein